MLKPTLFRKFLFPALLIALLPLLAASVLLYSGLEQVRDHLAQEVARTADRQASETLQNRARHLAEAVSVFLEKRESDLRFISRFSHNRQMLQHFYRVKQREIWVKRNGKEHHLTIPVYRSLALIDANGQELFRIDDGMQVPDERLRDVSKPQNTDYRTETYFNEIQKLADGEIYVSRVTGFHITIQEQEAGKHFEGVIRFGMPLYNTNGKFDGALVLSLDHQHLMEFTQHVDPGPGYSFVEPSYASANYAFIFDDEGWIITHPKYWDLRGLDKNGQLVPPLSPDSTPENIASGQIPFNLDHAGFIHPNYPKVANAVRQHQVGTMETTNVGRSRKIMAFAPILYNTGTYKRHGVFGGVTIGLQMDLYYAQSSASSRLINLQLQQFRHRSGLIMAFTALLAGLAAWRLAKGIIRPIQQLNREAQHLAAGDTASPIHISGSDELAQLTDTFNQMAHELEERRLNLLATLSKLQKSRQVITDERNFKESILESISSAIITFDTNGLLTSTNATANSFLGKKWSLGTHYAAVFRQWEGVPARIALAITEGTGYGREPLMLKQESGMRHFDLGIFPIGPDAAQGITITLRDETLREKLREETIRLDRLASLGRLAAGISHEIRNPLTGVTLLLDDLHDRYALAQEERKMLERAIAEIERVERLVASMLSFATPPRTEFKTGRLDETVQEVAILLKRSFERQNITMQLDCQPLPPFLFDPDKIRQAVLNLLKNGLEAMPDGGLLTVRLYAENNIAIIRIADSGTGICEDDLPILFEPFFTRKGAGTGLGLSITRRIIEEHGGSIEAENMANGGACFTICLPLA